MNRATLAKLEKRFAPKAKARRLMTLFQCAQGYKCNICGLESGKVHATEEEAKRAHPEHDIGSVILTLPLAMTLRARGEMNTPQNVQGMLDRNIISQEVADAWNRDPEGLT